MKFGQSITDLQDQVFDKILKHTDIVKALVIDGTDFMNITPISNQLILLNNPKLLIRQQIFPYRKINLPSDNAKSYISTAWLDFKKQSNVYISGKVYFYVIVPISLEKTTMGIRYNFIADKLDEIFCNNGIGEFEFYTRGDIDVTDGYIGHFIAFNILDFHINESDSNG